MKWFVPREHGAWAMLIVPYLLGVLFSKPNFDHLLLFLGILSCYFATGPILSFFRRPIFGKEILPALFIYVSVGLLFIIPYLIKFPFLLVLFSMIIPFLLVNLAFTKMKKERLFINDFFAIFGLSLFVLIAFYVGKGELNFLAYSLMAINIFYFVGSVFHVKTFLRERGNVIFARVSNIYHGLLLIVPVIIGFPYVALAFIFSTLKTWFIPKRIRLKPITIGIIEMVNSVAFVLLLLLVL